MAAPTYSLSVTGYGGHNPVVTYKPLSVGDSSLDAQTTATPASIGGIMADGDSIICKDTSGRLRVHKFDAERSDPSRGLYYLLPQ
jgi:hypothetical protein